ncbi:MAG: AI-2E family transporter [Lachnospiraceae bacterium]|nr:AI-2E family transporter [Lachnospiraceae bacterium]
MKLPWGKEYLKIAFHAVAAAIVFYIAYLLIKNFSFIVSNGIFVLGRIVYILKPLIFAVLIACFLSLPVQKAEELINRLKFKRPEKERLIAVSFVYGFLFMLVLTAGLVIYKKFENAVDISESLNNCIEEISDFIVLIQVKLAEADIFPSIESVFASLLNHISLFIRNLTKSIIAALAQTGDTAFSMLMGFILSFYILCTKEKIIERMKDMSDTIFSPKTSKFIKGLFSDITGVFSGYIGGQLMDAFIMSVLISVAFSIIGIKYAVFIGIVSGFSNLVPYVGALVAFALSILAALLSGSYAKVFYAAIAVIALQQIDSWVIIPRVMGKRVFLNSAVIILLLLIGGRAFGIWGMVFAVPFGALVKLRFKKYSDKNVLKK